MGSSRRSQVRHYSQIYVQGNLERIVESIKIAKERGATLRVGPELEIPYVASWNSLRLVSENGTAGMAAMITSWKVLTTCGIPFPLYSVEAQATLFFTHGKCLGNS